MTKSLSNEIKGDILVVDDDMPSLRALSSLLMEHGYQVRSARDGSTALMMAAADPPDLVLLDVIMPDVDGFQVCQRLKRDPETSEIPVIFVSALDEVVDKVQGFEVGGVDYITKPFNAAEVEVRVRTHLALHRLRRELDRRNAELRREISERQQAQTALQASEARLKAQYDGIPIPTYTWQGNGDDLVLVDYNTAAVAITQSKVGDFVGMKASEMYRDRPDIQEDLARCLAEKRSFARQIVYEFMATGETKHLAAKYAFVPPDLVLVHTEDVTARVQAEEELRASRQFIQSSLDALSAHIAILDSSGTILAVNASWRRFADQNSLGWEDYGVGRSYLGVTESASGDLSQGAREAAKGIREVLAGQRDEFRLEYPCHSPEEERWFVLRVTQFESSQGIRLVTSHEDVTERRQAEDALRARTKELGERVKELNCLYGVSALIEQPGISLEEILQGTVDLIPPAWQYPEITCARIVVGDQEFRSENYQETVWKQASPLTVHGEGGGQVEVCFLEERPDAEEGPFLRAERNLLDAIAERLGRVVEWFRAEEALRRRVEELSALIRVAQVVATAADLGETLGTAVQTAAELFDARTAVITMADVEEAELRIVAGFEPTSGAFDTTSREFPLDEMPITRQVLDSGQSTVLADVRQLSLPDPVHRFVSDLGLRAMMLVPLKVRGAVIGVLSVGSDQTDQVFTPGDIALAETIANDVAAAVENARLSEEARAAAVDTERSRLARELHDSVTQALYSITLHTDATLLALAADKTGVAEERLRRLKKHAREAMTEMRLLIHELRPSILEQAGLVEALKMRLESVEARSGFKNDLQVDGEQRRLPAEVEDALYRVALEGLNNVLKHARAGEVELGLSFEKRAVRLTIRDDGTGFDLDTATRYGGYGLAMIKERVQHIDGVLSIETAPGAGTTLRVEVNA